MLDSRKYSKIINNKNTISTQTQRQRQLQIQRQMPIQRHLPILNQEIKNQEIKNQQQIKIQATKNIQNNNDESSESSACNCSDCAQDTDKNKNKFEKIVELIEKRIINKKNNSNNINDESLMSQMSQVFKNIVFLNNYFTTCINHLDTVLILAEKKQICKNVKEHFEQANKEFNEYILNASYNNLPIFYNTNKPNTTIKFPFLITTNEDVNNFLLQNIGSNNTHFIVKLIKLDDNNDIKEKINTYKLIIENNIKFINIKKDLCNKLVLTSN